MEILEVEELISGNNDLDDEKKNLVLKIQRGNVIARHIIDLANFDKKEEDHPESPSVLGDYVVLRIIPGGRILVMLEDMELFVATENGLPETATMAIEYSKEDFVFNDFVEMEEPAAFEYYKFAMWAIGADI